MSVVVVGAVSIGAAKVRVLGRLEMALRLMANDCNSPEAEGGEEEGFDGEHVERVDLIGGVYKTDVVRYERVCEKGFRKAVLCDDDSEERYNCFFRVVTGGLLYSS